MAYENKYELEEAAEEFAEQEWDGLHDTNGNALYTEDYIKYTFIAGAEWQKEQDNNFERFKDYTDKALISLEEAREQGRQEMKEQMLKGAVEATVMATKCGDKYQQLLITDWNSSDGLHNGDKVRLIVLKDEE